jgi:hypothetical protein
MITFLPPETNTADPQDDWPGHSKSHPRRNNSRENEKQNNKKREKNNFNMMVQYGPVYFDFAAP